MAVQGTIKIASTFYIYMLSFYKKKIHKKMRLKWPESSEKHKKMTRLNFQSYGIHMWGGGGGYELMHKDGIQI